MIKPRFTDEQAEWLVAKLSHNFEFISVDDEEIGEEVAKRVDKAMKKGLYERK